MMVNGLKLVDITVGEARKLMRRAMGDHKVTDIPIPAVVLCQTNS